MSRREQKGVGGNGREWKEMVFILRSGRE